VTAVLHPTYLIVPVGSMQPAAQAFRRSISGAPGATGAAPNVAPNTAARNPSSEAPPEHAKPPGGSGFLGLFGRQPTTAVSTTPATVPSAPAPGSVKPSGPAAKIKRPLKIEPKTYFANERTFIQWISAGVLIFSLSIALMTISPTSRVVGLVVFPISILFFAYALWLFLWRVGKINARERGNYFDSYGPWFFSIALTLVAAVSLAVIWTAYAQDPLTPSPALFCTDAPQVCMQSSLAAQIMLPSPWNLRPTDFIFSTTVTAAAMNINQSLGAFNCSLAATAPARVGDAFEWERTQLSLCTSSANFSTSRTGLQSCEWGNAATLNSNVSLVMRYNHEAEQLEAVFESTLLSSLANAVPSSLATQAGSHFHVIVQCPQPVYRLEVVAPYAAMLLGNLTSTTVLNTAFGAALFSSASALPLVRGPTTYSAYYTYGMTVASRPVVLGFEPFFASEASRAALGNPPTMRVSLKLSSVSVTTNATETSTPRYTAPSQTALQQTAKVLMSVAVGLGYVVTQIDVRIVVAQIVSSIGGFVVLAALCIAYHDRILAAISAGWASLGGLFTKSPQVLTETMPTPNPAPSPRAIHPTIMETSAFGAKQEPTSAAEQKVFTLAGPTHMKLDDQLVSVVLV
jgi:uncharacterized membrane protein YidH (DUF202 family)